ncbi:sigma-70 family RNA polymerase sigma factor [Candidatus Saccharibacteria bacterium]|nr:sigma-70 family RNA polymerase sigma factor [Candidatus Saccharibacteria bacterium]
MSLEELYDSQFDKVYKFFYIQCLNRHVAEDLTSSTFTILVDKYYALHIDDPKKYLYGIMRKVWLEYLREKYQNQADSIEQIEDFESFATETVEEYDKASVAERLRKYVEKLPEAQRKVVVLRHYHDKAPRQVAEELEKDMNYVKVTYRRAIKTLREIIKDPNFNSAEEGAEI